MRLVLEANPFADYTFELDKTEAYAQIQTELTLAGCLLILTASSSFKYARIIIF